MATLSLATAGTGITHSDAVKTQTHQLNISATDIQLDGPTLSTPSRSSAIISRSEADSMRSQEMNLLSNTEVSDIRVGAVGNNELIYILLVVLIVVVIIKVL